LTCSTTSTAIGLEGPSLSLRWTEAPGCEIAQEEGEGRHCGEIRASDEDIGQGGHENSSMPSILTRPSQAMHRHGFLSSPRQ
jgi:hypothetical protein